MEGMPASEEFAISFSSPRHVLVSNGVGLNWLRNVLNFLGAYIFINSGYSVLNLIEDITRDTYATRLGYSL